MANGEATAAPAKLTTSASFKYRKKSGGHSRVNSGVEDVVHLLHGSDPVRVELTRLENEVREKDRELGEAHAEIKGLKHSERLKEKAVEELSEELQKVDGKLKTTEANLESKNLEIKKINEEKKAALAAQFAAEATLRRVHAAQKDDDMPPIEAIIAPLEAELKLSKQEIAKLQDDNRALDRLTKSKEAALLEAEKTVQMAMAKASMVDDLQNKNQELMKQIEICQEENKILDKMHRQKVAEVEKLTQTVRELEEAVLAGGAAANAVRDYQRKVQEMNGEMQQLKDKLAVAERTAKAEAQLKEKYQLRFKVLEERLRGSASANSSRVTPERRSISSGRTRRQSLGGVENFSRVASNGYLSKRTTNSPSGTLRSNSVIALLKNAKNPSQSFDGSDKSQEGAKPCPMMPSTTSNGIDKTHNGSQREDDHKNLVEKTKTDCDDYVSGALYDMLQKEVVTLRKSCNEKAQSLKDKDDAIEMLSKKVETLNKAMEVEAKKMRREVAAMEKEVASMRTNKENDQRNRRMSMARGVVNGSQPHSARNIRHM
uniref:Uncharacterized protein n=1 Tax=Chenopodium quinoa TaxID=63459 RepID=A0A803MJ69_CHEQI